MVQGLAVRQMAGSASLVPSLLRSPKRCFHARARACACWPVCVCRHERRVFWAEKDYLVIWVRVPMLGAVGSMPRARTHTLVRTRTCAERRPYEKSRSFGCSKDFGRSRQDAHSHPPSQRRCLRDSWPDHLACALRAHGDYPSVPISPPQACPSACPSQGIKTHATLSCPCEHGCGSGPSEPMTTHR